MRRIILGLVSIVALSGLVFGATSAFFSDTETSLGNIFKAGKIDLKIDHARASYNGEECEVCDDVNTGVNLVLNGGFENPTVTDNANGWQIFPSGTAGMGWTVEWEPGQLISFGGFDRPNTALLELHRTVNGWAHAEGSQHTELDSDWFGPGNPNGEPALVYIYQNVPTEIGKKYQIRWAFSPRPNTAAGENVLSVRVNDVEVKTNSGAGGAAPVWTDDNYTFTATSTTTKIGFASGGTANSLGTLLDNVRMHPFNCAQSFDLGQCKLWNEKDLTDEDFFWNFSDVKLGDWGRNVISYRVYDNDAWMCTLLGKEDHENDRIDPEIEANDTTEDPLGGELSKYLSFFVWKELDGDGLYEPADGEVIIANDKLKNLNNWPIAESGGAPVPASQTGYIGVAWCFGGLSSNPDGTFSCSGVGEQNDSQTDSVDLVLQFYAEQSRNNSDFKCATVPTPQPVATQAQ